MPAINALIKPASGNCNMKCDYCFYRDKTSKRNEKSYGTMSEETLKNEDKSGFIVRDLLAFDRTFLANERTLLSYIRTSIGLIGAGVALLKVYSGVAVTASAICLIAAGPVFLIIGIFVYVKTKRKINNYMPDEKSS